jgi:putative hydrolase of the HAD superfamily
MSGSRRIAVVSFDGDDTLWEFLPVLVGALEASRSELARVVGGPEAAAVTLEDLNRDRAAAQEEDGLGPDDLTGLRRAGFARTIRNLGHDDPALADRLTAIFLEHRSTLIEPYPDVLPMLDQLAERYELGLISNGNADTERCALRGRFAFRVHAHEHGVGKPDPALFRIALAIAGREPDEMVHVGDSLPFDVVGAQAAGVPAVWLNRTGAPREPGIVPDAEIASLEELPAVLDGLP